MAGEDRSAAFRGAAESAIARYALAGPCHLTPLASGHNHVYQVDSADGRFVLRLQPTARMNEGTIAVLLPWLASAGATARVVVPEPVPLPDGSLHWQVEVDGEPGARWCMLLRWVDGERPPTPADFVQPEALRAVGAAVARLHRHAKRFGPPTLAGCRRKGADWLAGPGSALGDGTARAMLRPDDYAAFRSAAECVTQAMRRLGEGPVQFGPIHADLEPGN
jgi:Ser/Thr protein kinase RdoA (MazF antagonist)